MIAVEDVGPNLLSEHREVVFELDRFELAGGRLELAGRWFGVKGRRFMRPSLTLRADDREVRLLADLVHKPWTAENGMPWRAAFPCDDELGADKEAELTVAPDLTVELAVPRAARSRRRDAGPKREAQRQMLRPGADEASQPVIRARRQDAAQTQALSSARAEIAKLRKDLEELGSQLQQERTRFDHEIREGHRATAEVVRGRDEAIAARREAIKSREAADERIERALIARGKARKAAERALAERDDALARLERALATRDKAVAQRDKAITQRDQAVKGLKRIGAERNQLAQSDEQLRHRSESAIAPRGAPPVMRKPTIEPSAGRRHPHRVAAALAATSLLAVALAVIIILSSH